MIKAEVDIYEYIFYFTDGSTVKFKSPDIDVGTVWKKVCEKHPSVDGNIWEYTREKCGTTIIQVEL